MFLRKFQEMAKISLVLVDIWGSLLELGILQKMGSLRFTKKEWHPKTPGISPASPMRNDTSFYEALAVAGLFQRKFFNRFSSNRSRWVGQPDDLPITPIGVAVSRYSWILFVVMGINDWMKSGAFLPHAGRYHSNTPIWNGDGETTMYWSISLLTWLST